MIKGIIYTILLIVFLVSIVFSFWWIKKSVSYNLFYENSVESTIKKMVKPECLK